MKNVRNPRNRFASNWPTRLLIIASIGIVAYAFGVFVSGEPSLDQIAKDVGVALCVAVLIGFVVDRLLHESLLLGVDSGISRLEKGSDVLRGAARSCVEDMFARRGSDEDRDRWETRIRSAIRTQIEKGSGELLIACVAAPQFFRNDSNIGEILWREFPKNASTCRLRVLLLCPTSNAATDRAKLEDPHPTLADIKNAATFLDGLGQVIG